MSEATRPGCCTFGLGSSPLVVKREHNQHAPGVRIEVPRQKALSRRLRSGGIAGRIFPRPSATIPVIHRYWLQGDGPVNLAARDHDPRVRQRRQDGLGITARPCEQASVRAAEWTRSTLKCERDLHGHEHDCKSLCCRTRHAATAIQLASRE